MSNKNNDNKAVIKKRSGWYLIWEYASERPFIYFFSIACIAISSILATVIPRIIGDFTDTFNSGKLSIDSAIHFALLVIVVGTIRVTLGWIGRLIAAQHGRILMNRIREKLFKKWETMPLSYYHGHSVGDLLSHALSDVEVVRQVAAMGINVTVNSTIMLMSALYVMVVHMNWELAIAGLGPLIAIPVIVRYYGPRIKNQSAKLQAALGVMSQSVEEIIGGIRTVKAFGNEKVIIKRFEDRVEDIVVERMKFVKLSAIFTALIPFMASIGFIVVIGYGGYLTIIKSISLGDFVTFLLYLTLLRQPLEMLGNTLNTIQRGSASLARISDLLEAPLAVFDHETAKEQQQIQGDIEVRNLSFRYPGTQKDVLSDISFTVKRGQTLGIIGTIGSGKTSLAHLLMRVYEPPRGTVFVDGVDVQDYYLKDLRKSVAYVPQNGFLFSTTIQSNIAFADDKIDENKVLDSAKISAVHKDILKLKEAYATEIGERGVRLSGGQKQRVAIARMIYKDSPVNVLDDSLSAVDTKTERLILRNMREYRETGSQLKTNIIISHRLSAVMHADEIIILDQGQITDRGNHQQLLESSELYGKLWNLQSGGEGRSEPTLPEESPKTELLEVLLSEDEEAEKVKTTEGGEYGS